MAAPQKVKVGGILHTSGLRLVGVMSAPDRPGIAAAIFRTLAREGLNTQFIVQIIDLNNDSHVLFCVAEEDLEQVVTAVRPVAETLKAQRVTEGRAVATVSVYGPDFRERPGLAGAAFAAIADAGINILAVSTSISTITCVIDEEGLSTALEALYGVFDLP